MINVRILIFSYGTREIGTSRHARSGLWLSRSRVGHEEHTETPKRSAGIRCRGADCPLEHNVIGIYPRLHSFALTPRSVPIAAWIGPRIRLLYRARLPA